MLRTVCARISFYQQQNINKVEEPTKVKIRVFNYYASIHQNNFIGKSFSQEEEKICEVS